MGAAAPAAYRFGALCAALSPEITHVTITADVVIPPDHEVAAGTGETGETASTPGGAQADEDRGGCFIGSF